LVVCGRLCVLCRASAQFYVAWLRAGGARRVLLRRGRPNQRLLVDLKPSNVARSWPRRLSRPIGFTSRRFGTPACSQPAPFIAWTARPFVRFGHLTTPARCCTCSPRR